MGKPLHAYLGVDPTAPAIHLGHTAVVRKLKHFQDMRHIVDAATAHTSSATT
jgi:tyrosyl-tRNA synthetase